MAKPIKETPVLYDEDAYRFEMAVHNVVPLPAEEREKIRRNYEEVKKRCKFSWQTTVSESSTPEPTQ